MSENSFIFYRSFLDAINELPEEYRYKTLMAIINYGLNIDVEETDGIIRAILTMVIPNIDSAKKRYERAKENGMKGKEYGKLGGRPSKADEIIELYNREMSKEEISALLDVSTRTIERIVGKYSNTQNPSKPLNIDIDNNDDKDKNKKEDKDKNKNDNINKNDDTNTVLTKMPF